MALLTILFELAVSSPWEVHSNRYPWPASEKQPFFLHRALCRTFPLRYLSCIARPGSVQSIPGWVDYLYLLYVASSGSYRRGCIDCPWEDGWNPSSALHYVLRLGYFLDGLFGTNLDWKHCEAGHTFRSPCLFYIPFPDTCITLTISLYHSTLKNYVGLIFVHDLCRNVSDCHWFEIIRLVLPFLFLSRRNTEH